MLMESGKSIVLKEQGNEICCKCHAMSDWLIAGWQFKRASSLHYPDEFLWVCLSNKAVEEVYGLQLLGDLMQWYCSYAEQR